MMSPRELAALIIAPPLAPVVFVTVMDFPNYMGDYFQSIKIVALLGIPIAYLIALCLGLPLYYFAKDRSWVSFWSLSLYGAVIADLSALLTLLFLYGTWEAGRDWRLHGTFLITGFVVGAVFWSVLRFLPSNLAFKRDALKRAP